MILFSGVGPTTDNAITRVYNNFWFPERSGNVRFWFPERSQERSLLGSQESFLNVNRTFPLG